ncbi:MAG: ATP-binding cassette domain-containing protein [Oscillospiraceae bacterium]|nr:ATP-binding cassette domain-containing protein [Oscillospiraceae bacterium]
MALTVNNISKSFGDKKAVDNLSFEISRPGVFGLLGTNGAGKTTTIRMILGIMEKDQGEVSWNGLPVNRNTVKFGYMPEERGIYPKVRIEEQLVYFAQLRGMSKSEANRATKYWMDRLGVTEYAGMLSEKLSKGNQQKIQLIATLIHNPTLIFMDEPFSGLDPINTDVFKGIIDELIENNCTIIMSSHQMHMMEQYCQDLVILDRGRSVLRGNLREIKAGYGHTNLSLKCDTSGIDNVKSIADKHGLTLIEQTADGFEFKINGDEDAQTFLRDLIDNNIYPERYEIREPSLHEIFIEKVGAAV